MKTVFTVFRSYTQNKDKLKVEAQDRVLRFLEKDYLLKVHYDLQPNTLAMVRKLVFDGIKFDAILSQVPPIAIDPWCGLNEAEKNRRMYGQSLGYLDYIRRTISQDKRVPIIAYTAAKPEARDLFVASGIDAVVLKTNVDNWETEAREIKGALDRLVR